MKNGRRLTLFAVPKASRGLVGLLQKNAIKSWTLLQPCPEIILVGDEEGVAELANEYGLVHIPGVAKNEFGTPLVSSIFNVAEQESSGDILCYVNADIILTKDFLQALYSLPFRKFLLVGRRWDIDLTEPYDFSDGWEDRLKDLVRKRGSLHPSTGIDYFAFSKGVWGALPPFALGRTIWDNYLIYLARRHHLRVVDGTAVITAVHQNHDYGHVENGVTGAWSGPEALQNQHLAMKMMPFPFDIRQATWKLTSRRMGRVITLPALRHERLLHILHLSLYRTVRSIYGSAKRIRNGPAR